MHKWKEKDEILVTASRDMNHTLLPSYGGPSNNLAAFLVWKLKNDKNFVKLAWRYSSQLHS